MGLTDKIHDALTSSKDDAANDSESAVEGPAAAGGVTSDQQPEPAAAPQTSEVSSAGSGSDEVETSAGGADSVPSTPDDVAENFT